MAAEVVDLTTYNPTLGFYNREGNPIDSKIWGTLFADAEYKILRQNKVRGSLVSTVWLGVDHSFGQGSPLIFETMIFGGRFDDYQERYSTEQDALVGHQATLKLVRNGEQNV